jgi:hypothetical protein
MLGIPMLVGVQNLLYAGGCPESLSNGIETTEKGTADASGEAVKDAHLIIFDIEAAGKSHDSPHFTMSNYQGKN